MHNAIPRLLRRSLVLCLAASAPVLATCKSSNPGSNGQAQQARAAAAALLSALPVAADTPVYVDGALHVGLVCDFGDTRSTDGDEYAAQMASDADKVAAFLRAGGYTRVDRISQFHGNSLPFVSNDAVPGMPVNNFLNIHFHELLQTYANLFDCQPPPPSPGAAKCHEFFLYLSAHGYLQSGALEDPNTWVVGPDGGLGIFGCDGRSGYSKISYRELFTWLGEFPKCVKIIVFIDSCFSGQAVRYGTVVAPGFTENRDCGWTVFSSCGANEETVGGTGVVDSASTDWDDGGGKDLDGDGIKGSLEDRWLNMVNELNGGQTPDRKMAPGQQGM